MGVNAVVVLVELSASLGILGSLFIIVTFLFFRPLKHHRQRLIFFMSICNLLDSCAWFLTFLTENNSAICVWQASLIQMFGFAGLFWSMAVSISLLRITFSTAEATKHKDTLWEIAYHVVSWSVPLFMTFFLNSVQAFGSSGPNGCWIDGNHNVYRLVFGYDFIFLTLLVNSLCAAIFISRLRRHDADISLAFTRGNLLARRRAQTNLALYLLVFAFVWVWGSVNRIIEFVNPADAQNWLFYLQAALEPGIGFGYAIIFGWSERAFVLYRRKFFRRSYARKTFARMVASQELQGVAAATENGRTAATDNSSNTNSGGTGALSLDSTVSLTQSLI